MVPGSNIYAAVRSLGVERKLARIRACDFGGLAGIRTSDTVLCVM